IVFFTLNFFIRNIILLILIYTFLEAIFLVNSTYIRFKYGADQFFYVCFFKIFILSFLLGSFFIYDKQIIVSIKNLIMIFSFSNLSIVYYLVKTSFSFSFKRMFVIISNYKSMLLFSIGLLPHTLSQWVSSSSDRFFVKLYTNDIELGYYSFSYSLAAIFMIVNSSLALGIPQLCVKNFIYFNSKKFYSIFFSLVSILWVLFLIIYIGILYYFSDKYDVKYIFKIGYVILVGMYFLSFYYYYSSFLFYDRASKKLSYITFFVAVLNVSLVVLLTPLFGILGTAFSTLISYLIYVLMSYKHASVNYTVTNLYAPLSFIVIISVSIFVFLYFFKIGGVSYV
ncbi:TPA: polysaccharide biosynthesis protein, partial [Acinetobacter baumannii]|nr:polysaccharide biosynthesis protein [Acinetobacter baumannii]